MSEESKQWRDHDMKDLDGTAILRKEIDLVIDLNASFLMV